MVARRSDAFAEAEETKWNITFWGQVECCRTERTAAMDPRMYAVSNVIATWMPSYEQSRLPFSSPVTTKGQSGEL